MSKGKKYKKSFRAGSDGKSSKDSPVRAKKFLGQHFLKDEGVAKRIAQTLRLDKTQNLLEIGPGTGVLTKYLLEREANLAAMELDRESVHYLKSNFVLEHHDLTKKGFEVIEANFLSFNLETLFGGEDFAIIGNFPYNISSQIVFRLLDRRDRIPEFSGMFQQEVAARICETEGSKVYGILSVLVQAYFDAEYLFTVPPEVFDPPPKVQSGVLRLTRKDNFRLDCDEKLFFKIVKAAFNQRRKTLRNSLKVFELSDNLKEDAIFDRRPEQMAVADFVALTKKIADDTV